MLLFQRFFNDISNHFLNDFLVALLQKIGFFTALLQKIRKKDGKYGSVSGHLGTFLYYFFRYGLGCDLVIYVLNFGNAYRLKLS